MKAHELFQRMSPETAAEIFVFIQKQDKQGYKMAIQGLANQRNLRAVFVERKPPNERHPWMKNALSRPVSDTLATHLVQAWLLSAQKPMLNDFLDALGIPHDEDGTVEDLGDCPPKEKLQTAVDNLVGKYPAEHVIIYLHAFRDMDSTMQWPALNEILSDDARLQFAAAA